MRSDDEDVKRNWGLGLVNFDTVMPSAIDNLNERYFKKHNYSNLDKEKINLDAMKLSKLDKIVIAIKRPPSHAVDIIASVMSEFAKYSPIMFGDEKYYYVLSAGAMNLLLDAMNNDRLIRMAPIFGNINLRTLYEIHQAGYHPVNLYSPHVLSNSKKVHNVRVGPVPTALHDLVAHLQWASLLTKDQYRFIYEYLIPTAAEILSLTILDIIEQSNEGLARNLFKLIDLNIENRTDGEVKDNKDFYLCECILYALSEQSDKVNAFEVADQLHRDKDQIQEKYGIDILTILSSNTFFPDTKLLLRGS